ncbi:BSD domain-containing protein, putative [Theobroma cacao]|uniref:BSD domain-containing protein, putative n=1 Tax=Theobroma cacao TaxID=3641 RepID=A0A061GVR9_THECC|nr:BSD domain-containing protein, putative [Theobroma cacao]
MSWLLKSLQSDVPDSPTSSPDHSPTNRNAGVKEDLSVLGETIGRQLRGVAAFLAPPPSSPPSVTAAEREQQHQEEEEQEQPSDKLVGIRNDLAEIGGSFKSGLSLLSSNKAVTEISKFASSFLQFPSQDDHGQNEDDDEDDDDGVPGITEDVVEFVKEISNRPEFWTDFPLTLHNDFKMSEAQREHAENIEHLVPSFEDLKVNLHSHMGDERFWMIYFILLLPRLNEHDFELLSTPEVVKTRDALLQKLQNNNNARVANSSLDASEESSEVSETKRENASSEEKVSEIVNAEGLEITDEENAGQWLEEGDISSGSCVSVKKNLEDEEDVSFSDLEDDDNYLSNKVSVPKSKQDIKASSPSGSNDWVQLNKSPETRGGLQKAGQSNSRDKESEGEESNDWLTDDDFVDVASGH